jgi:hypothetical protein
MDHYLILLQSEYTGQSKSNSNLCRLNLGSGQQLLSSGFDPPAHLVQPECACFYLISQNKELQEQQDIYVDLHEQEHLEDLWL